MFKKLYFLLALIPTITFSQVPQPHAAEILLKLKKLNVLGSVLYVAAHPDDENTRLITSLGNDEMYTVGYLSMTRGDGGQNLVGQELGDKLGILRTQELLAARRIDGGQQFFTRAIDFGFSKSAEETLKIWDKDAVLSDVVKVYREFQPDVVITRFPADERAGHGHHTASALLAQEAFDLAADPQSYAAQVKLQGIWQPQRLLTNTGRWWNNTINEKTPGILTVNIGRYSPLLGESFSEIGARSRSQHKSQGFGAKGTRGDQLEFLEPVKGSQAASLFDGIDVSWHRVKGGERVLALTAQALARFNPEKPYEIVSLLIDIRRSMQALDDGVWKRRKLKEVEQLIADCSGLFFEATASAYYHAPGTRAVVQSEMVNRSQLAVKVLRIRSPKLNYDTTLQADLAPNISVVMKTNKPVDSLSGYSAPYWLQHPHTLGLFHVKDEKMIGRPANDPAIVFLYDIVINGEALTVERPLVYKWGDPVKGELYRPVEIVPPVLANIPDKVYIFNSRQSKEVGVKLKASSGPVKGVVRLKLPAGWKCEPSSMAFDMAVAGEEQLKLFYVTPSSSEMSAIMRVEAQVGDKVYTNALEVIQYDHIPTQIFLPEAQARVVYIDLKKEGTRVGYIKGAGDEIPAALRNMGYDVVEMNNQEVTPDKLKTLDAVVLGIRVLNTNERIAFMMDPLLNYVKEGGSLIFQYNTHVDMKATQFSPYNLTISRERVTEEDAEVRMLKSDHPVFNYPNKITPKDFDGWVQERGLYFPGSWGPEFEALLSMNDKKEPAREGSLLLAKYGAGYYVYTGLSFFRELPEGVTGAYRLFANIVSIGKHGSIPITKKRKK